MWSHLHSFFTCIDRKRKTKKKLKERPRVKPQNLYQDTNNSATMANNDNPLPSREEILNNTSQSSSSGTTGLSSYNITNGYNDLDMEDSRDETRPGCGVDQGVDHLSTPQALHPVGGGLPRTGPPPHTQRHGQRATPGAKKGHAASS